MYQVEELDMHVYTQDNWYETLCKQSAIHKNSELNLRISVLRYCTKSSVQPKRFLVLIWQTYAQASNRTSITVTLNVR